MIFTDIFFECVDRLISYINKIKINKIKEEMEEILNSYGGI